MSTMQLDPWSIHTISPALSPCAYRPPCPSACPCHPQSSTHVSRHLTMHMACDRFSHAQHACPPCHSIHGRSTPSVPPSHPVPIVHRALQHAPATPVVHPSPMSPGIHPTMHMPSDRFSHVQHARMPPCESLQILHEYIYSLTTLSLILTTRTCPQAPVIHPCLQASHNVHAM